MRNNPDLDLFLVLGVIISFFLIYFFGYSLLFYFSSLLYYLIFDFPISYLIYPGILTLAGLLGYFFYFFQNQNLVDEVNKSKIRVSSLSHKDFHLDKLQKDSRLGLYKSGS